jgi:hypothetical protein
VPIFAQKCLSHLDPESQLRHTRPTTDCFLVYFNGNDRCSFKKILMVSYLAFEQFCMPPIFPNQYFRMQPLNSSQSSRTASVKYVIILDRSICFTLENPLDRSRVTNVDALFNIRCSYQTFLVYVLDIIFNDSVPFSSFRNLLNSIRFVKMSNFTSIIFR